MDWDLVISSNRERLLRIVAALFAMAGLVHGADGPDTRSVYLPRSLRLAILLVLRPAESAVRRLIIIAARGLVLKARASRPFPAGFPQGLPPAARPDASRLPAFALTDPLKHLRVEGQTRFAGLQPHIRSLEDDAVVFMLPQFRASPPVPDYLDAPERLCARLSTLRRALDELPKQARRLARWRARRDVLLLERARQCQSGRFVRFKPIRISPTRPGLPPGHRQRHVHEVDGVLGDCHYFANEACLPDTS